jgi:7,8-dihydropterin-6-yl-methyl-4-(beta-D-ribofuranosyl)aminobenzene 5'-phosphate synthase
MTEPIKLEPVDCVEITTLYENLVDMTMPGGGAVKRLAPKAGKVVSTLLAEEKGTPFTGGHGLSMLVRVTRNAVTRSLLFDTGGSPDGLVHNLDCLELDPRD